MCGSERIEYVVRMNEKRRYTMWDITLCVIHLKINDKKCTSKEHEDEFDMFKQVMREKHKDEHSVLLIKREEHEGEQFLNNEEENEVLLDDVWGVWIDDVMCCLTIIQEK